MDRVITTLISIVAAVGGSALLFIGANKLFDLARSRYAVFGTVSGGLLGFLTGLNYFRFWSGLWFSSGCCLCGN